MEWQFSHDSLHVCFAENSFVVFFPLKGEKRYRIVGVFPEEFDKEAGEILYEEIESRIKTEAKLDLDIQNVEWFSTYKVHTRHVSRFSTQLSRRRLRAHSYTRRSARDEYRHSRWLQPGLETCSGHSRQSQ